MKFKRKNKKENKVSFIGLVLIYFIVLFSISVAYSLLNVKLNIESSATINAGKFSYTYVEDSSWNNGDFYYYQFTPTITYLGNESITGWQINIYVPSDTEVTGCYNASSCEVVGNVLRIRNASYNGVMTSGSTASPGFQLKMTDPSYEFVIISTNFYVNGGTVVDPVDPPGPTEPDNPEPTDPDEPINPDEPKILTGVTAAFTAQSGWGNITSYTLDIKNKSETNLTSWRIEIEWPEGSEVANLWNANYVMSGTTLILTGPDWSTGLNVGATVNAGMQVIIPNSVPPYSNHIVSFTGVTENNEDVVIKID